ncbi:MAG TPA: TonB family protein [Prolixibacteraceae bacterium]
MIVISGILPLKALSQEVKHTFKIVGKERIQVYIGYNQKRLVEYDPKSSDHLYISDFGENGFLVEKSQYLFKGDRFDLLNLQDYISDKKLQKDGIQILYSVYQEIASELIYKIDTLQGRTYFYRNGNKQMTVMGDEKTMNGEFKMWLANGQLTFSGNYKNNLKDGQFESFDESTNQRRKGIYELGKLISGESVVQDFVYDAPDVPAQSSVSDSILNNYLKMKTAKLPVVKKMKEKVVKEMNLRLTIGKTGSTDNIEVLEGLYDDGHNITNINILSKDFPVFKPALMEGAPVNSILNLTLLLSNEGLQIPSQSKDQIVENSTDSLGNPVYRIVEEMPEFPGGYKALRQFIAETVQYPISAQEKGIQGKVYVSFVIQEDGSVARIKIEKSVHPSLDSEAIKVIKQMHHWKPGHQSGKAVKVSYTVPITFLLKIGE